MARRLDPGRLHDFDRALRLRDRRPFPRGIEKLLIAALDPEGDHPAARGAHGTGELFVDGSPPGCWRPRRRREALSLP